MAKSATTEVMLEGVRIAFPALFEATRVDPKSKPRFSCCLLMDPKHPGVEKMKEALRNTAAAQWGDRAPEVLKQLVAQDRTCLRSGDTKPEYDGFPGNLYVSASNRTRPTVVDRDCSPLTEEDGVIYSGCYVNAKIEVWAQDNQYGKRLNGSLKGVQFAKDGEAFSGGGTAADPDEFADMSGVDETDEFAGGSEKAADNDDAFGDLL